MAKILLAIPTLGSLHERTSAAATVISRRLDVDYITVTGRPVDYVRNGILRMFLSKDFTHLMLLDSDVEPPLDCIERLLALDVPLATGCYPVMMHQGLRWALANKDADQHYRLLARLESDSQPFEVDAGGAGCILIRRDVFDKVAWPWFKWVENEDGSQTSEDIYFFQKCNEVGLRMMVEPTVICNHFKEINITDLMRLIMQKGKAKKDVD